MKMGIQMKFYQNPELLQLLLDSQDDILIEDSPSDLFWGGKLRGSKNTLGVLLMEFRERKWIELLNQ